MLRSLLPRALPAAGRSVEGVGALGRWQEPRLSLAGALQRSTPGLSSPSQGGAPHGLM